MADTPRHLCRSPAAAVAAAYGSSNRLIAPRYRRAGPTGRLKAPPATMLGVADVVIIGGGPGGYEAALVGAQLGDT